MLHVRQGEPKAQLRIVIYGEPQHCAIQDAADRGAAR
jgi:hypothetical protein